MKISTDMTETGTTAAPGSSPTSAGPLLPMASHGAWPVAAWNPDSAAPPPGEVLAGTAIPDVRRPCDAPSCPGMYLPEGEPFFDADGSANIGLACSGPGCGRESAAYWGWDGDCRWAEDGAVVGEDLEQALAELADMTVRMEETQAKIARYQTALEAIVAIKLPPKPPDGDGGVPLDGHLPGAIITWACEALKGNGPMTGLTIGEDAMILTQPEVAGE